MAFVFDGNWRPSHSAIGRHSSSSAKNTIEFEVANMPGVQAAIDGYALEILVRAQEDLKQHALSSPANTGDAFIEMEKEDVDRLISLNDSRGQNAALSIEYGHGPYDVLSPSGQFLYHVGESGPTWILHNATHLPKHNYRPRNLRKVVRRSK